MEDHLEEFTEDETLASGWKRFLLGWIDVIIVVAVSIGLQYLLWDSNLLPRIVQNLTVMTFSMLLIYRLFFVFLIGSTIGMYILNLKLLNGYGEKLNLKERLLAALFVMINGTNYYIKKRS